MVTESPISGEANRALLGIYSAIRYARCAVILDVDETLLSCMEKWRDYVKSELNIQLSLKQIRQAGSVDDFFLKSPLYADFTKWAEKVRVSIEFNTNLPAVKGSQKAIQELSKISHLQFGGYLTARPSNVMEATLINLQEKGFPPLPIVGRPASVAYLSSVKWKLDILRNLRNIYDGVLVMIDDSTEVALEIQKDNDADKYIDIILIKTPYNLNKIRQERITTRAHMYVANWSKVPSILRKMYPF